MNKLVRHWAECAALATEQRYCLSVQQLNQIADELERITELEARTLTVKLPEGKDSPQGWKVDPEFIRKVQDAIGYDEECQCWEGTPSMEIVEAVLIAAAGIHLKVEE